MSKKPDCFGRDIEIRGLHGHLCRTHPDCLYLEDCYDATLTTLYIGHITEISESEQETSKT